MEILHFPPNESSLKLFYKTINWDWEKWPNVSLQCWQMIVTAVTLFCSIVIAGISLMCMNRTTQAGRYEGFDQSQNHKAAEPGNAAFEESPVPANEPEPFTSSIPETSMILTCKETPLRARMACILNVLLQGTFLNYILNITCICQVRDLNNSQ